MSTVPEAPVSETEASIKARHQLSEEEAAEVYQHTLDVLTRELAGAFRDVPQTVYDDLFRRVAAAIVSGRRKPAGQAGQLTRTDQPGQPAPRDPAATVRGTLALYVSPL